MFHKARYACKYYAGRYGLNDGFEPPNDVDRALSPRLTARDVPSIERDGFNRLLFGYVSFITSQAADEIARDLAPLPAHQRVWVVLGHAGGTGKVDQQIIAWLDRHGTRLRSIEEPGRFGGCAAYLSAINADH